MSEREFTQIEVPEGPHRLQVDQDGYRVEVEVVYDRPQDGSAGRFVCDRLTVSRREDGPPITSEGIREIAVAELIRLAVAEQVLRAAPRFLEPVTLSERAQAGGGPSEEDLRALAATFQLAYAAGEPPIKAVMERLGLPRSTANRWAGLARKRGMLGPPRPRKAGG